MSSANSLRGLEEVTIYVRSDIAVKECPSVSANNWYEEWVLSMMPIARFLQFCTTENIKN